MARAAVIVIIILAIAGGGYAITRDNDKDKTDDNTTQVAPQTTQPATEATPPSGQQTVNLITYSTGGFSPATLTVKSGSTVTIKNDTSEDVQFDSDPHPTHTDHEELNIGDIGPGESKTVTLTTAGTYGYHNHLNPSDTGKIIVE